LSDYSMGFGLLQLAGRRFTFSMPTSSLNDGANLTMPSASWEPFESFLETSSGGPSRPASSKLSTRSPFNSDIADRRTELRATFEGSVTSVGKSFAFRSDGGGEDALKRTLGCIIIAALPSEGLEEAWESLTHLWHFHTYRPPLAIVPPRRALGRVTSQATRPPLDVSED
jgi:hypothetical protein